MTQSEARRILSELTETMGKDGTLVPNAEQAAPGCAEPSREPGGAAERSETRADHDTHGAQAEQDVQDAQDVQDVQDAQDVQDVQDAQDVQDVQGDEPLGAWEDLVPGKALRWPKCECGSPKCPDYGALRTKVAERNRRSSRGGT